MRRKTATPSMTRTTAFFLLHIRAHLTSIRTSGDPEDLWDFGTVRHAATVGRAKQNPVQVSGPPLTWENTGSTRSDGSSSSGRHSFNHKQRLQAASHVNSVNAKGELPPLPGSNPATPRKHDYQGTVRQGGNGNGYSREPSDEYDDDYDEDDIHGGPPPSDDDLPDTTMLDSVVLPAIASVSNVVDPIFFSFNLLSIATLALPSGFHPRGPCGPQRPSARIHRC